MKREAALHINTEEFIYPLSRSQLVIRFRAARKEIRRCTVIYWDRTDEEKKKEERLQCYARDELFDYFQGVLHFSKIARYQKYYFCMKEVTGKIWYYTANGIHDTEPKDGYFEYLFANANDVRAVPEWAKGIIYYQIFPERFYNGDKKNDPEPCEIWGTIPTRENYMGGDLRGIIQKIPYLEQIGIECLYINPIFKGDFNHKYATTDYFEIDSIFGTKEELRELVEKCHTHGIRILLDGVFNHTGVNFKPFQDVLERQEGSLYKDWFLIQHFPVEITHHDYECVGAYKWMPKLNSANPQVRKFIIEVMEYWIKEYQIDGWRLDVSDEVDATVWREARLYLKERYPDILLVGETWGYGGRLLRGDQMDAVMNYLFRDAVLDYFGKENISEEIFDYRINHMLAMHREDTNQIMYNLLDSHDTERFLSHCGENTERMKLAIAFQMMFIGSPAVYYGDEAGMTGGNDPDCRRCMLWDESVDQGMFRWYQLMIQLRKRHDAIRKGSYKTIIADRRTDTFAFVRQYETETIYIILHKGNKTEVISCPVLQNAEYEDVLEGCIFKYAKIEQEDHFYNEDIMEYQAKLKIVMKPYSVKVINQKTGGKKDEER